MSLLPPSYKMVASWILFMMCLHTAWAVGAKALYIMDKTEDCNFVGRLDVNTDQSITIIGKTQGSNLPNSITRCNLLFQVADDRDYFDLSFKSFYIGECDILLFISLEGTSTGSSSYDCNSKRPGSMMSPTGVATIRLERRYVNKNDYNFEITLRAYKPDQVYQQNDVNPMAVGMVVGIIGGIIGLLLILAVIGICCYRKKKQYEREQAANDYKRKLDDESNTTYGYDNDARNGGPDYSGDTPGSNKKLLMDDNTEYNDKRGFKSRDVKYVEENEGDSSNSSGERKAPLIESYSMSPKKSMSFDYDAVEKAERQESSDAPKSPLFSALQSNPRFRKSFAENEVDAEERRKRISSYSSGPESINDPVEEQPTIAKTSHKKGTVPPPPPLPNVPKSPGHKRSAFASIRRAPRPSSSSEEIQQIERGSGDYDDRNIKVIREKDDPPSPSEIVPIKVSDPHKTKGKSDTQHTLRPNRKKSPKDKRKQSETGGKSSRDEPYEETSIAPQNDREQEKGKGREKFQKNTGLRKSSRKSPRVGRGSRPSIGSILDDNESIGGRDTPTSQISRFTRDDDDDDLDSNYQPLRRSDSRQSLYASRSSLYGRRGKRRRGSMSESVVSYARDDIDAYSERDFEERRVSRRESMRKNFRSLGDLEYESREISTQTLRETASQTGRGRVASTTPKKGASKKTAARKQSTSSTTSRKPRAKKSSTKDEEEREEDETENGKQASSTPKTKSKVRDEKPKIQPKPKPAPRKSASAKHLPDNDTESDAGQVPAFTVSSGVPYPGQMVPGGPSMTYAPVVPGQPPQYIAPGGMPMMQSYPAYPGAYPGHPVPPVMYAPVARMPTAAAPQQAPTQAPGQPPSGAPGKSGKSSWDILCAITDNEKERSSDNTETGSVAGSVFSQQQPNPYTAVQYPPPAGIHYPQPQYAPPGSVSFVPNSYMPSVSGPVSDFGSGPYTGSGPYPASTASSHHSSEDAGPKVALPSVNKAFPRQASWEVLNDMAKAEKTGSHKTESIV